MHSRFIILSIMCFKPKVWRFGQREVIHITLCNESGCWLASLGFVSIPDDLFFLRQLFKQATMWFFPFIHSMLDQNLLSSAAGKPLVKIGSNGGHEFEFVSAMVFFFLKVNGIRTLCTSKDFKKYGTIKDENDRLSATVLRTAGVITDGK